MKRALKMYPGPIDCRAVDSVNCRTDRVERLIDTRQKAKEHICAERSRIVTESWKKTDGQPLDIRRAKLFRAIMEENPVVIRDDELIVGSQSKYVYGASPSVDYNPAIALENIKNLNCDSGVEITEADRQSLAEDAAYWSGISTGDAVNEFNAENFPWLRDWAESGLVNAGKAGNPPGTKNVDFEKVIRIGYSGFIEEARAELQALEYLDTPAADYDKANFLKAVIIALEGAIEYAHRYSRLAAEMAEKEADPVRRKELQRISETCLQVPEKPARSFYEAVQSFWLTVICMNLETAFNAECPSRLDQYLYPLYFKDVISEKNTSREEAAEILACLMVKFNEMTCVKMSYDKENIPGTHLQATTICGVTSDGGDASNELSYMLLEVLAQVCFPQPPIYVRYHNKINREVWLKAIEVNIRRGDGNPSFMSDESRIVTFVDHGIPLEDARNWAAAGCAGSIVPSVSTHGGSLGINYINLAKIMEYVLNDGKEPRTGKQIGLRTGDPRAFTSIEQFIDAFKAQFDHLIAILARMSRMTAFVDVGHYRIPFISSLLGDCIKKGADARLGGVRYPQFLFHVADRGLQDVADSLAAIDTLVFETKRLSMDELLDALSANFEGFEQVRAQLRAAPKYGNDDDYVDDIFSELSLWLQKRMGQEKNPYGTSLWCGRSGAVAHVNFGKLTGALPNGHRAGEPLADGFCSPAQGCDTHGPTCTFNSASKVLHVENSVAALMNMKFERKLFDNKANIANLASLIENYFHRGGFHVQINILDRETLEQAQENPQEYRNLMVRVAGYSAFFVDLPRMVQDEIMSRTNEEI